MRDGWESTDLGSVCSDGGFIQTGPFGSQLHAEDYRESGVPVVMPVNIGDGRIVEAGIARISEDDAQRLSRHRMRPGDIVYSRRGDITRRARAARGEGGWLCGTGCLLVRCGPRVDPIWLTYWLGTPWSHEFLRGRAVGATMPNLNTGILSELPVLLPPLPEQRAIAGVLGALDDLIDTNQQTAALAEELAQTVAWSTDSRVPLGRTARSDHTTADPVATVDHYSLPAFDAGRLPERVDGSAIKSRKTLVASASVLVSRLNPHIPRIWMAYPDGAVTSLASTEFVPLTGDGVPTEFVYAACCGRGFIEQMASQVTGTTGSHQRVDKTALLTFLVPDYRDLSGDQIATIKLMVQDAYAARREAQSIARTRDELLPLLMSGAVSVREVVADAAI